MNEINTLQALLDDVKGNVFLNDAKKKSGHLKSMSLLSDAMSRHEWQQFELDVIDELKAIETNDEMVEALDNKVQLAKRELELSQLQMKLMDFHACAASSVFFSKEGAAVSLRKIADEIEAKDTLLFPKPWSAEDTRAYAEKIGATYIESLEEMNELLETMKSASLKSRGAKKRSAKKASKVVNKFWPLSKETGFTAK